MSLVPPMLTRKILKNSRKTIEKTYKGKKKTEWTDMGLPRSCDHNCLNCNLPGSAPCECPSPCWTPGGAPDRHYPDNKKSTVWKMVVLLSSPIRGIMGNVFHQNVADGGNQAGQRSGGGLKYFVTKTDSPPQNPSQDQPVKQRHNYHCTDWMIPSQMTHL